MSAEIALLCVFLLPQAVLAAAPGPESAATFDSTEPARCALLWAPEGRVKAEAVSSLLQERPELILTIAAAPEDVDDPALLAQLADRGRIELALRIPGDPILPLIESRRPQDAASRIVLARQSHQKAFGRPPKGLVPGAGAFSSGLLGLAAAQGLRWVSVGDYTLGEAAAAWFQQGGVALVPTKMLREDELWSDDAQDGAVFLMDSKTQTVPARLAGCAETAAQLAEAALRRSERSSAPGASSWPAWTGPASSLSEDPESKRAWALYAEAAEAVTQYQNSGRAGLNVLDKAVSALYATQDSRFFRPAPAQSDAREFQARLRNVYKILGMAAPNALQGGGGPGGADPEAERGQDTDAGSVRSGRQGSSLWFELVPAASSAAAPSPLTGLRVDWDEDYAVFSLELQPSSVPAAGPRGSPGEELILDVYIDINHRPGAGSVGLLPGRAAFLSAADAWEYALSIAGGQATLFRYSPGQGPTGIAGLKAEASAPKRGSVVRVPRSRLPGNPAAWGYLALALPANAASAAKSPPQPSSDAILGALAVIAPPAGSSKPKPPAGDIRYRRFSAIRLEKGAAP